ncbi:MAG TPA: hypothetical protein VNO82_14905, partial [Solirubrobacteraceae bacterium]|nr:hypothetical protein [Solirubrobacteraceae bacterium]
VQHVSTGLTMTRRVLSDLDLRLFYSGNVTSYCPGTNPLQVAPCVGPPPRAAVAPALSAPPTIADVDTSFSGGTLTFEAHVVGELVAGIQGVWVTWTIPPAAGSEGRWAPIDLVQDTNDPSLWTGELEGISNPANVHFLVQAVNGVGKVTVDDNLGAFYRPGSIPGGPPDPNLTPTTLAFTPVPTGPVEYGDSFSVTATLMSGGNPLPGKTVRIGLGAAGPPQTTNASGQVTTIVRAALTPSLNPYPLTAAFSGDTTHAASDASVDIIVAKQPTSLAIAFPFVTLTASTTPQPTPLHDRTVIVTLLQGGDTRLTFVGRTDPQGRVRVPASSLTALPQGSYTVVALFEGDEGYAGATATAGNGLNVIRRGSGSDRITGTDGSDLIIDTGGSNTIDGRGGNDIIISVGNGSHTIVGGTGDDWIETGSGSDKIDGGAGNDTIHAGNGSNDVTAGSGDDVITAGTGSDKVNGGAGFDVCHADGGSNNVSNCEA